MKICHISDIHIRNCSRIEDYLYSFEDLYKNINDIDIILLTGDLAHTKVQLSPEYFDMSYNFLKNLTDKSKYCIVILGNHDRSISDDRLDAVKPVVNAINSDKLFLLRNNNIIIDKFNFINFDVIDIGKLKNVIRSDKINCLLYHGIINNSISDNNYTFNQKDYIDIDSLKSVGIDFGFFGDIHRSQFLSDDKRFLYAGSLIQQNYGEEDDRKIYIYDIHDKNNFTVKDIKIKQRSLYVSIHNMQEFDNFVKNLESDSVYNVRFIGNKNFIKDIKNELLEFKNIKFNEKRFIVNEDEVTKSEIQAFKCNSLDEQNMIITEFIDKSKDSEFSEFKKHKSELLKLNSDIESCVQTDVKHAFKKINYVKWENFGCYSEGYIDFTVSNFYGLFAPNAKGKSTVIDVILYSIFGDCTKGSKINIINNNFDKLTTEVCAVYDNKDEIIIKRSLSRDNNRTIEIYINGKIVKESKKDLENLIKEKFGTYDQFLISNCVTQFDVYNILFSMKSKKRREFIFTTYGIDVFNKKYLHIKSELSALKKELNLLNFSLKDYDILKAEYSNLENKINKNKTIIENIQNKLQIVKNEYDNMINLFGSDIFNFNKTTYELNLKQLGDDLLEFKNEFSNIDIPISDDINNIEKFQETINSILKNRLETENALKNKIEILHKYENLVKVFNCNKDCFLYKEYEQKFLNIDQESLKNEIQILNNKLSDLIQLEENTQSKLKESLEKHKIRSKYLKKRNELQGRFGYLCKYFYNYIMTNDDVIIELNKKKSVIDNYVSTINNLNNENMKLTYNLGVVKQKIDDLTAKLNTYKKLNDNIYIYSLYEKLVSPDILQSVLFKKIINYLNNEMSNFSYTNFNVHFVENDNELDVVIKYLDNSTRDIELCSGMEKTLANLLTRVALLKYKSEYDIMIFDESFASLDEDKIEVLSYMFNQIKKSGFKILLTTHDLRLKDKVDYVIDIHYNNSTKLSKVYAV